MPDIYLSHFQGEPPEAPAFYETLGRCLVVWGRVETMIDDVMLTILASRELGASRRSVDRSFSNKLKLWRELFGTESLVAGFRDQAMVIADRAEILHRRRSRLFHASLGDLDSDGGAVAFQFEHLRGVPHFRKFKLDLSKLQSMLSDILDLAELIGATAAGVHFSSMRQAS